MNSLEMKLNLCEKMSKNLLKEYEEMFFYPQIFFMENGEMQAVC